MTTVSVVIPTYNRAHLLNACLRSVKRQTYRDFEIVVIDDGSGDSSAVLVAATAPEARYLWQKNAGVAAALNRGVHEAHGEYISFLASDDELLEDALATEVQLLDENPNVGLVYGQAWQMHASGAVMGLRKPGFAQGSYIRSGIEEVRDLLFWDHITCSTVMVRRRCLREVGPFETSFVVGEDWDMWMRLAKKYDVAYVDRPLARYLKHSDNISMRIDLDFLEAHRAYLLNSVFSDPDLIGQCEDLKAGAYFNFHRYIASMSYKVNDMRRARRHLLTAVHSAPGQSFRSAGLAAAFLFAKTLIPVRILDGVRWLGAWLREKAARNAPVPVPMRREQATQGSRACMAIGERPEGES